MIASQIMCSKMKYAHYRVINAAASAYNEVQ